MTKITIAFAELHRAVERGIVPRECEHDFPEWAHDMLTASEASALIAPNRVILFSSCGDFDHGEPSNEKARLLGEESYIAGKELVLVARCHCHESQKKAFATRHGMLFRRVK